MNNLLFTAAASGVNFNSPGYASGTELPPVPVDNMVEEIPFNTSSFNSEYLIIIIAALILVFIVILIVSFVSAVRKNQSISEYAGFEELPEEMLKEELIVKEKPKQKKTGNSKLSTPQNLKSSIKGFLERTQNL